MHGRYKNRKMKESQVKIKKEDKPSFTDKKLDIRTYTHSHTYTIKHRSVWPNFLCSQNYIYKKKY